jgi:alpha-L-rhamnosidase
LPYRPGQYGAKLVAQVEPPVRVAQELKPVSVRRTNAGTYVFDMGQNMVGRVRLKISGARGTRVVLNHAEVLEEDGSLHKANLRTAVPQDTYILKGEGTELYEPSFTYHGFRYVELKGYPGEPDTDTVTGIVMHTAAPISGKLETSHPGVNRLQSNIVWGQRGNFFSVPTDCPQRDERLGWTGDAQVFCRTALFNMEAARFFTKYVTDMVDAQLDSGSFPDVAPNCGYHARKVNKMKGKEWVRPYSAGWADAGIIIPWTLYQAYGDKEVLETSYDAMVTYMGYLNGLSVDRLIPEPLTRGHGDWLSLDADTPKDVLSNAYYAYSTDLMARIAAALGKAEDAQLYRERAERIKSAFQAKFVAPDGKIKGETQTAYAAALYMGLLTETQARLAARHLADDVERRDFHPTCGFLGIGYLLPALSEYGYSDVAYRLLLQESHPSWLSQIAAGATTMWERWDGWTAERGLHPDRRMNSFNHFAFGSVGEWMYRYMAGINTDPDRPGYKHIRIRPRPDPGMTRVHAEYESLYGTIVSSWRLEGDVFRLQVSIPAGATATVTMPDGETHDVGSGEYEFAVSWGK